MTFARLRQDLEAISPWFVPAALRPPELGGSRRRSFGSGSPVAVRSASSDSQRLETLTECLDAAGLAELAGTATTAAVASRSCSDTTAVTAPTSTTRSSWKGWPATCGITA